MPANGIPPLHSSACLLTHRCSTASEVMVLSSSTLNDGSSTTKMLPLSVPRYRTSREEWGRTAVICVALGGDLGRQRDLSTACKRLSLLNLRELTTQQQYFEPGIISLKKENTSLKINYVRRLLSSAWTKTLAPFYRSLSY